MPDPKLELKRAFHYALEAEELLGKHVLRQLTIDELQDIDYACQILKMWVLDVWLDLSPGQDI